MQLFKCAASYTWLYDAQLNINYLFFIQIFDQVIKNSRFIKHWVLFFIARQAWLNANVIKIYETLHNIKVLFRSEIDSNNGSTFSFAFHLSYRSQCGRILEIIYFLLNSFLKSMTKREHDKTIWYFSRFPMVILHYPYFWPQVSKSIFLWQINKFSPLK